MTADTQLLRDYATGKSQDAFTELVRRHLDLVYSAALRQVRSPQLAEEISQSVFTDLARAADTLKPDTIVTAWLYQVTRRTAIDVIRRESRRQARERLAVEMAAMNTAADWNHIEPLLEDAMETLGEADRAAILLRYFENKSLREVGQTLGTSDDAAQKRVSRAVERLREFFSKQGVAVGAGGLVVLISANAVQAAPLALASTISTATVLAGTTVAHASTAITATKAIAMTTLQKTLVTSTIVILAGATIFQARETSVLTHQMRTLQQQQAPLAAQNEQLRRERDEAVDHLSALSAENTQLKSNQITSELLKLRSEVTRFEAMESDPVNSKAKEWLTKVNKLKQRLADSPSAKTSELQFIKETDWLDPASVPLQTEADYRRALARLRSIADNHFATKIQEALVKYTEANNQFPTELNQLLDLFNPPIDPSLLDRWEIVQVKNSGLGGDFQITEKTTPDEMFDSRFTIGTRGFGSTSDFFSLQRKILNPLYDAYKSANHGHYPEDPSLLLPYATSTDQQMLVQKLVAKGELEKQLSSN